MAGPQQQRTKAAQQVMDNRTPWAKIFQEMTLLIPPGIWLENLKNTVVDGQERLSLIGLAPSQKQLVSFFGSLENSYYFRDITIKYAEKQVDTAPSLYRFEFECLITSKIKKEGINASN